MRVLRMRTGIVVNVKAADRRRLTAIVANWNSPQKHVWRARIVLLTADGLGTAEIMRQTGKRKSVVWRWQERFMRAGVEAVARQVPPSRKPPLDRAVIARVIDLTGDPPLGETTHWTAAPWPRRSKSASAVQRIWRAHGLTPHRGRQFKLSNDPAFAEKLRDVVGLYVDPPDHAVVLSIDEKSQIQALDRTQPGLPMKKGRAGTMTHDYKRHGTTTLFAALDILDGTVIGRCMPCHRHQEFIRFLTAVEAKVPKRRRIHVIVDNYATHKHPNVRDWLARHPRWTFHFTPTSASWLNAVEGFFAKLTGGGSSAASSDPSSNCKPPSIASSTRPTSPKALRLDRQSKQILAAVKRGRQVLESSTSVALSSAIRMSDSPQMCGLLKPPH